MDFSPAVDVLLLFSGLGRKPSMQDELLFLSANRIEERQTKRVNATPA
jgi:hypothetical protein